MNEQAGIRKNLLITTAVIVTVVLALFMSQQDGRDGESLIGNLVGTVETGAQGTPLSILLPTTTATALEATTPDMMATATVTNIDGKTAVFLNPYCGNAPADWLPHTVHDDETIYSLSITSGATIAEIVQANCLAITQMLAGLTIYLPPQPPARIDCGPPNWWLPQKIHAGDTLYGLSVRHGTTVYAIMNANCLSNSYLMAGRTLYLPPLAVPPTAPPLPTMIPTIVPSVTVTAVPTMIPSLTPTIVLTLIPTMTATIPPTQPPITPTMTLPPSPTMTFTPLPTIAATETAVSTPTNTSVPTPTPTPLPPTATSLPSTATPIP